jgi:hypothetical protein
MNVTLNITIDENTDPALRQALTALLGTLNIAEQNGSVAIAVEEQKLIGIKEVTKFVANLEPHATKQRQQETAWSFYSSLAIWTMHREVLPLVFVCPSCKTSPGTCRCPSLGSNDPYGHWYYEMSGRRALGRWQLDVASVVQLTRDQISSVHPKTAMKLRKFADYLLKEAA